MKLLELGGGLEIWKVPLADIREQDENARVMTSSAFDRLTTTIKRDKRDKRLESLPLCAKTDKGVEVLSGHHRVRAALAAELAEIHCIVDVSGLSRDQIRAKQLAHNSIQGIDNPQILSKIFNDIQDAESKLEAFIDEKIQAEIPKVKVEDIAVTMKFRSVGIMFMPIEKEAFEQAVTLLGPNYEEIWAAELKLFEPFQAMVHRVSQEYEIRSMGTILAKMGEIVSEKLGAPPDLNVERRSLRDIFGASHIPVEVAAKLDEVIAKMKKNGDLGEKNRWQALEYLAADFLAG